MIAGHGTMGLEIVEQVPDLDAVLVPVGGGGLIAGVALAVKSLRPDALVYVRALLTLPLSTRRSRVFVTIGCPSVRLSVCPIIRPQQRRAAGLRAGDIDRQRCAPGTQQHAAAARRSAANAGSAMSTAESTKLDTGLC